MKKPQYLKDKDGNIVLDKETGLPIEINKRTFGLKEVVWRSYRDKKGLPDETQAVIWKETLWGYGIFAFIFSYVLVVLFLWMLDFSFFPNPPTWIVQASADVKESHNFNANPFYQLFRLLGWFSHLFFGFFPESSWEYRVYLDKIKAAYGDWPVNVILIKLLFVPFLAAVYSSFYAVRHGIRNPVDAVVIKHKAGAQVFQPDESEEILAKKLSAQSKRYGKHKEFAQMSHNLMFDEHSRRTHTLIFGTTGSGKSQVLAPHLKASIKNCKRTVILDPKREFANALFNPKDKSMAIIDFTDKHGSIPDIFNDINGPGLLSAVVAGMIPPEGNGDGSMWVSAAQAVSKGLIVYLQETTRDPKTGIVDADWIDMSQLLLQSHEDLAYAIFEYYPEARVLVGELNPDGTIKQNVTTAGIMINMFAKSEMWTGIAKYMINNRNARKISLEKFMTDPDYEVRTLFIYPNAEVETISRPFVSMILSYLISFIDNPRLLESETEPIGNFFLDEFHAPGKMSNSQGLPVVNKLFERGRSKGWGAYVAVQDINQLWNLYKKEDVQGWLGTACNFICTGANGETLKAICDSLGKKDILKLQVSETHQQSDRTTSQSKNWQKHTEEALLPSDLSKMLEKVEGAGIRYYYKSAGVADAFILEKPFEELKKRKDNAFTPVKPSNTIAKDENSRVSLRLTAMREEREKQRLLAEELEKEKEHANEKASKGEIAGSTYYDDEPSDEEMDISDFDRNNERNKKIYDLIDLEGDSADELASDMVKDSMLEAILDSHAITTVLNLAQTLASPYKNLQTSSKQVFEKHQKEQMSKRLERVFEKDMKMKEENTTKH